MDPGGARQKPGTTKAGSKASGAGADDDAKRESAGDAGGSNDDGTYIVGDDKGRRFRAGLYSLGGAKVGEGPYYADGTRPRSGSGARDDEGGAASDDRPGDNRPGGSGPGTDTHVLAPARAAALQEIALMRQAEAVEEADHGHKDEAGKRRDGEDAHRNEAQRHGGAPGAYAPKGTAAPAAGGPLGKDGKPLTLRFVLPRARAPSSCGRWASGSRRC